MPDPYDEEVEPEEEQRRKRLGPLIALLATIAVIIFLLLMLRGCGKAEKGEASRKGKKTIEAVEGYTPVDGAISIWIDEKSSLDDILTVTNVEVDDYVDMGGGRFILDVTPGSEDRIAAELAGMRGVHDTGRVYEAPK